MPNFRDLTFEYIETSRTAATPDQLCDETLRICAFFEIEGIFVADVPEVGDSIAPHILLAGWNSEWISRYVDLGYVHLDPVAKALTRKLSPYLWSEACDGPLSTTESMVMGEAAEFGLTSGVSVPVFDARGRQTCVSFAGHRLVLDEERRGALQLIGFYAHARLKELRRRGNVRLSRREGQCLQWASRGKTNWETSRILELSPDTIAQYTASAIRKLGAVNRTQGVAEAIRRGLIH